MSEHTKEPWHVGNCTPDCWCRPIVTTKGLTSDRVEDSICCAGCVSQANAARIVACVNLLAGIPTEDVETWLSRPDSIHFCSGRAELSHLIRSRAASYLNHKAFLDSVADAHKEFREKSP